MRVESYRNVVAHWRHSAILAVVALLCGFASVHGVIGSTRSLTDVLTLQTELGANAFVVSSPTSQNLVATDCEALRNIPGVRSAGTRLRVSTTAFISAPGTPVTIWDVTPGFVAFTFPDLELGATDGASFGRTIATDLGAVQGSMVIESRMANSYFAVSGVSSLSVERVRGSMQAVLVPVATNELVNSCFVEAHPAYRDSVEMLLASWFGPTSEWVVSPLAPPEQFEIDIGKAAQNGPMQLVSPLLAGFIIFLVASLWWSRRHEFALYSLLGFGPRHLLGLLSLEWSATVFAPTVAGGIAAFAVQGIHGIAPPFIPAAITQIAMFYVAVAATPAIGFFVVQSVRAVNLLKGA